MAIYELGRVERAAGEPVRELRHGYWGRVSEGLRPGMVAHCGHVYGGPCRPAPYVNELPPDVCVVCAEMAGLSRV